MGVYFRANFQVSSIILTSFRQGGNFTPPPPPPKPQNEPLKIPPRLGLNTDVSQFCKTLINFQLLKQGLFSLIPEEAVHMNFAMNFPRFFMT